MKKASSVLILPAIALSLTLAIAFSCASAPKTAAGLNTDTLQLADQKMQAYIDEGMLPCISTLVIRDGKVAHQRTFGLANIEEGRALKEDAIFRIYSMSKPVTAAALMILYDEGKFQLNDPVARYIPEFENTRVYVMGEEVDQQEPFTIRHLLTHTAGFCYGWAPGYVDSLYTHCRPGGIWSAANLEEMIKCVSGIPLKNQPGSVWEYSISIDVAGYLAEVLSGMPFDEFLQTRLFGPLGMEDTGFEVPAQDSLRLAMIYTKDPDTGKLKPVEELTNGVRQDVTLFSGGGGLVSTIGDYARFGQMLLNGGELDGVRILQESTVKLIMSDQLPPAVTYQEGIGYGLGGQVVKETGEYSWTGMASTAFTVDARNNMVILAFTQYVPHMEVPFASEFHELVRRAIVE